MFLRLVIASLVTLVSAVAVFTQERLPERPIVPGLVLARPVKLERPVFPDGCKCVFARNEIVYVVALANSYGNVYQAKAVSGHPGLRQNAETAALNSIFTSSQLTNILFGAKVLIGYGFVKNGKRRISVRTVESSANPEYYERCSDCTPVNFFPAYCRPPEYPKAANHVNVSGKVEVRIVVNASGVVESATLLSGHPFLRAAAKRAALEVRFQPTETTPIRIRTIFTIPYNFIK
jgi:TonB family protein